MREFSHRARIAARIIGGAGCGVVMLIGASVTFAQTADEQRPIGSAQGPTAPPEVVPPPPASADQPASPPQRPACDANCVRRGADFAAQACVPLLEAKAPLDYDWLTRPFGGMFTQAEQPGADGIVRYRGDSIRVLVQNQWLRHAYECAFDTNTGKIVAAQLRPGRLVPPAEIAKMAGSGEAAKGPTMQANSPAEVERLIKQTLQKGTGAGQVAAKPKPKPTWGEPGIVTIRQAHLRTTQIDSLVSISQASRASQAPRKPEQR
jgi:hypothetical protein